MFRFTVIGEIRGTGKSDISPFERGDLHITDGANSAPGERLDVEPWLPWFYKWGNVAISSAAFGFTAATLIFLNLSCSRGS